MSEPSSAPWEQQQGESSRAFGAFCAYRDLGPRRSLRAAAAAFYGRTSAAAERQVDKWPHAFHWVERANAWDRHLDAEARKAQEEARREMVERHVREARALQAKALERLRAASASKCRSQALARSTQWKARGAMIDRLARSSGLFGTHVTRRAEAQAAVTESLATGLLDGERDAEVGYHGFALVQQDVLRLDVPVDHPPVVRVVQRTRDLRRDAHRVANRQSFLARQPVTKRLAANVRHDVPEEALAVT